MRYSLSIAPGTLIGRSCFLRIAGLGHDPKYIVILPLLRSLGAMDGSHTRVTWTYSFKLKADVFPGDLGALGRFLFRVG